MEFWINRSGSVLFRVNLGCYVRIDNIPFHGIGRYNKRFKISEVNVISLASSLSPTFPLTFITIYYTDSGDIRYWHELRNLIKVVCA